MPSRILREGINSSSRINSLTPGAELFFRRLMSVVDDYGRFHGSPATLRAACWPTCPERVCEQDVSSWMAECLRPDKKGRKLIELYIVDGSPYLQIVDFGQKVRSKSKFPQPEGNPSTDCPQNDGASRISDFVLRNAEKTIVQQTPLDGFDVMPFDSPEVANPKSKFDPAQSFEKWWEIYWRKEARLPALGAFRKHCKSERRFNEIMAATNSQRPAMLARALEHRPLGASWLNAERWTDAVDESPPQKLDQNRKKTKVEMWGEKYDADTEIDGKKAG